ncbi:MAG: sigma-70 family RNA polymerase sigma factor [Desulfobacterales bacterium]|nr:sigma-70 family RNA polymerase sigma factor [Desulfobacterales bacterium]
MTKEKNQPQMTIQENDFKLVDAINAGHSELFYNLVKKYEQPLFNFGFRVCGEIRDAEEMVQDAFLNAYEHLDGFRKESTFKNWLFRIAINACMKKKRKTKSAPERELSLDDFIPEDMDNIPDGLPEWATRPIDQLLTDELGEIIKQGVLSLPEKYRLVFVLRDIEGFSSDDTGKILNISTSNVKVRLHRARLYMREKLKEYFEND